jgi:hypothetical protein
MSTAECWKFQLGTILLFHITADVTCGWAKISVVLATRNGKRVLSRDFVTDDGFCDYGIVTFAQDQTNDESTRPLTAVEKNDHSDP